MPEPALPRIEPLAPQEFDAFIDYLNDHLSDNGRPPVGYFQPLSREASLFSPARAAAFRAGLETPVGERGWRRGWVARDEEGRIGGHIDLRGHAEDHTRHRCLLGMGVHRDLRRQGLGSRLIRHAGRWAASTGVLAWIDLQVLGANRAAIGLYRRAGFREVGEVEDMFAIDGQSHSYVTMTLRLIVCDGVRDVQPSRRAEPG